MEPCKVPACIDEQGHNFTVLSVNDRVVFCTRCGGSVKYDKGDDK